MKALIHGYFGMGNVGDEAILSTLINEYRSKGYECIILSANPEKTARMHGVVAGREKLSSLKFWRHFMNSAKVVLAGGGRYGDATVKKLSLLAVLAKLMGKKVEFRSIGFYPYEWRGEVIVLQKPRPFQSLLTRVLLKTAIAKADYVSVRDEFSKHVLGISGVSREVNIENDFAFKLKPPSPQRSLQILSQHGVDIGRKPLIGVNLRTLHLEIRKKIAKVMSEFLDWLVMRNAEVVFVTFGYGSTPNRFFDDDLIVANELKKLMRNADRLKVVDVEYKPEEILGIFRFFNLFIGMRFHSIIFSVMTKIPTVAIVYDTKVAELKNREGHDCIRIRIDELSVGMLKNATETLLKTSKNNIGKRMSGISAR